MIVIVTVLLFYASVQGMPPPVITQHPLDTEIDLTNNNTDVSLTCKADRASSYFWKRQNGAIPSDSIGVNTSTLKLVNLQPEDAGNYRCVAANTGGKDRSNHAVITISIVAPKIVTHPTATYAAAPFSAKFKCSVQAYGYLTIDWYRNNNNLPKKASSRLVPSVSKTTSVLTIPNVTSEDVGIYYCEAWAKMLAARSHAVNLFLADPPLQPVVITVPIVNLTINNYNLTMKCLPNKKNFKYKWIKEDDVLPSRAQGVKTSQMTIVNLKVKDSGDYQCVMSNSTGALSSNFTTVKVRRSLPILLKQPNDININLYGSVSFECIAQGFGPIQIIWRRNEHNMPRTAVVTEQISLNEISSVLMIDKAVGYYSGQYYCVVTSKAGSVVSQTAKLHVQVPIPEMIISPKNVTVRPNHSFTMNCLALSFGLLKYNWYKRYGSLPQTAFKSYSHNIAFSTLGGQRADVYNLAVRNVQLSDEGWYCCVATNQGGSRTDCAWLEVNTLPIINTQPMSVTINVKDSNVTAMSCLATGIGPIYYRWEKYHLPSNTWRSPSHRATSITGQRLKFTVIIRADEGVYRCIVTNDDGSVVSKNASIHVYGPPSITFISNYTMSVKGRKVHLICIAINNANAIHSLQVNWYLGNQLVIPNGRRIIIHNETDTTSRVLKSTLLLDPVHPNDHGVYTCRALNRHDSYSESKTNLTVQYCPVVSIPNKSPYISGVGSLAVLYCTATGRPIPTVQWFKDDVAVTPIPLPYQQTFIVPTITSHTTVYTCKAINHPGNKKCMRSASVTVAVEMSCNPLLEAPVNGKRDVITTNGFAKYIEFSCNTNYTLIGTDSATCNNGMWSSTTPMCVKR